MTDQQQRGLDDILGEAHLVRQNRDPSDKFSIAMLFDVRECGVEVSLNQDIFIIVIDAQMLLHQG